MDTRSALRKASLFRGLPEQDLLRLAEIALPRRYGKGEVIFSAGEEARGFYLVAEGMVKIYRLSSRGRQQILHVFGPGEVFAEAALFSGSRYPAWAETLAPSVVLFFPRQSFLDLVRRRPELALNMLAVLSLRLRSLAALVDSLSLKEVPERLAAYLLYLAENHGPEFELEIPKGELAALLGTVPETLSRVLSRLSEEGLIEVSGRRIRILNEEGLRSLGRQ
ncbi:Crp/Fnr family transcriptional regulator [Thermosulfurimonas sp. F29]|uniref:Crp/Fnr family transcriptional regulator n=1 Tax=Thermosulfurimonas sp. F29 TaxID=2867247 RepID=UPI001C82C6E0|nr:Crp/Fnr family transcriptional regulator [Thermosulfurimonas sp. F29]MBX6422704.1 Crp/Fnr family transcriptional regulator [Thermosulfurimonas sp. F29]